MSKILWFVMLSVMLCYAGLWFLYESEQNLMPCYALLIMTWCYAGTIICEQNLMIPYEIDHVHAENNELGAFREVEILVEVRGLVPNCV